MKPSKRRRKGAFGANKTPAKGAPADRKAGDKLLAEVRQMIDAARKRVAVSVNAELTILYWQIGRRLSTEVLKGKRAEYGKQVIESLSDHLTLAYGKGWSDKHLFHCLRIAQTFPDEQILYTLCRQFTWSHLRILMYIDDAVKRNFYIEISRMERWSVRQTQERIRSMLFERTAISRKPEKTIAGDLAALKHEGQLSHDLAFRDPYVLDFLGLTDSFSEKDLESAILHELQRFIIELGTDFAFLARQKRITIDDKDYYIDLLFFHRRLKCLVVIDLKIGEFDAAYKGEMELYLRYVQKHETVEGENPPVGLILCAGKTEEHVELLELHKSNIRVAEYITALPPRRILEAKLHESIAIARQRLLNGNGKDI
jgi:predicted nuclease of restriction endonuclease-like (RecB) superfamily